MYLQIRLEQITLYNTAARLGVIDQKRFVAKNAPQTKYKRNSKQINLKSINVHKRLEKNIAKYKIK